MIIVDSSVWIDYFNGKSTRETDLLDSLLGEQIVGILDLIYIEVLQGFSREKDFKIAQKLLNVVSFYSMSGKPLAGEAIKNFRLLRSKGITVRKTVDIVIATFCISREFSLLHSDRDFTHIARLLPLKTA